MDHARQAFARYVDLGEELSRPSIQWYGTVISGVLLLSDGRLSQAEETIELARRVGRDVQAWDCEVSYRLAVTMLRWEQGRLAEVEDLVREATTRFPGYRVFRCMYALCHLEAGRANEAAALVHEILAAGEEALPYNNDWLAGMTLLAEVAHRLSLTGVASSMYELMRPFSHLVGNAGGEPFTGSTHRPLAQMATLQGELERAREHHEQALDVHTRMRSELWTAHSEFDLAEVLRAQNGPDDRQRAAHLYARALHRCETLGMAALAARIRAVTSHDHAPRERPGGLTKRELEVAALVATGASNRDIADALVISERTAESHVQNILTKLGFGSRAQIASWYVGVQH
jgi:DNA-binding CsgD family transcriptional regulator